MIIHVFNQQESLKFNIESVQNLVKHIIKEENQSCDEVSIHLVDLSTICELHKEFFDDPSPTDCISFPMDEKEEFGYRLLGEIFVCPATALEYSMSNEVDPYEETTLYIVHGLLHLMGYRDSEEEDILLIRQAEQRHMSKIKQNDLCLHLE